MKGASTFTTHLHSERSMFPIPTPYEADAFQLAIGDAWLEIVDDTTAVHM